MYVQEVTRVTGATVVTGVYKRLQGVAGGNKNSIGLQGVTRA